MKLSDLTLKVFNHINAKEVDEALGYYSSSYDYTAEKSDVRVTKSEISQAFYFDREMGAHFDVQYVGEVKSMPNLVTVEFIETSIFYGLLGLEKRRTVMQFSFDSDEQIAASNVLDSADIAGTPFNICFPQLFTWASLNRPSEVLDLPILPVGIGQPEGRRGFTSETAIEWLALAREWSGSQG